MNIFFLHTNPRRCARWHCDKHVVKMLLETCQLLYTCHWIVCKDPDMTTAPLTKSGQRGYKKSHWNHPCAKWVRMSLTNYVWLTTLGLELLREYNYRYPNREHACGRHIVWLHMYPPSGLHDIGWTEPIPAMPEQYKSGDAIASYRRYYIAEKRGFAKYTGRHRPHWLDI
jgi:uncharacterized CHY-type Zn-finger protein